MSRGRGGGPGFSGAQFVGQFECADDVGTGDQQFTERVRRIHGWVRSDHSSGGGWGAVAAVRLVNKDGDVIWATTQESWERGFAGRARTWRIRSQRSKKKEDAQARLVAK
jgi:hypothetical protein